MAEDVGVEPTDSYNTVYGLANRCLTVRPVLRREDSNNERFSPRQLKMRFTSFFMKKTSNKARVFSDGARLKIVRYSFVLRPPHEKQQVKQGDQRLRRQTAGESVSQKIQRRSEA